MNGSIERRSNSWRLRIEIGRDASGKRVRQSFTVRGTKADAQRRLRELLTSLDNGMSISTSKKSISDFFDQWLRDYAETNTSPRTVEGYKGVISRYIKPKLGHIALTKLTPQHVQELYSDLLRKGLSPRTVLHTHRVLSGALRHAVKWGLVLRNVCDTIDPPRPRQKEMRVLNAGDVQKLLEATAQTQYGHAFFLAIYTGLRRGELVGLRWSDVDITNKTLSVNQAVVRIIGEGLHVGEPKTKGSRRLISLSPSAVTLLAGLKARKKDLYESVSISWDESTYIFTDANDGPLPPDALTRAFRKAVKQAGIPYVRFHDLRHTHATLMLKQGVHPKIVSERLGHSNISITLDTYSHVLPGLQEQAALAFEESLQSTISEAVPSRQ